MDLSCLEHGGGKHTFLVLVRGRSSLDRLRFQAHLSEKFLETRVGPKSGEYRGYFEMNDTGRALIYSNCQSLKRPVSFAKSHIDNPQTIVGNVTVRRLYKLL